jgi:hypothetical protein
MRVFRVETSKGHGPYRSDSPLIHFRDSYKDPSASSDRPAPAADPGLFELDMMPFEKFLQYSFGFVSIEQASKWFSEPEWLEALDRGGFVLSEYAVDSRYVESSDKQAAFQKARATKVGEIRLTELMETA